MGKMNQKLYSLADAADALGKSQSDILALAAHGALRLYIEVPSDVLLYSVDLQHVKIVTIHGNPPYPPTRVASNAIFLEIGTQEIATLLKDRPAQQSLFEFALKVFSDGTASRDRAPVPAPTLEDAIAPYKNDVGARARRFATYSKHDLEYIEQTGRWDMPYLVDLTSHQFYVLRSQLAKLLDEKKLTRPDFRADVPLGTGPHISQKLRDLHALLLELWETYITSTALPAREAIEELLKSQYSFTGNQAEHGAAMIRRATTTKCPDGQLKLSAPDIAALIACSDLYWATAISGKSRSYPSVLKIVEELAIQYNFQAYRAKAAASIIRPDWGRTVGRKAQSS
jgi:hypothetical protein